VRAAPGSRPAAALGETGSTAGAEPSASDSSDTSPASTAPAGVDANALLLALVPAATQDSCTADTNSLTTTVVAALICHPGDGGPSTMSLYAYSDGASMTEAFNSYAGTLPTGACSAGAARQGTWSSSGATQGPLACYVSRAGDTTIIWGSDDNAVLAIAQDPSWTLSQMYAWWHDDAPDLT
jgi:hypothetical protein